MTVHLHSPKRIGIHLPITRNKLGDLLSDEAFEQSQAYIQYATINGYEGLHFKKEINLNEFNLLAEKLNGLDTNQTRLLHSILDCKFAYLDKNFEHTSTQNICSLIDNLHNFKLHEDKSLLDFDQMMRISTHESTKVAVEYIGTADSYVNNYAEYEAYEMPYHDDFIKVILLNEGDNSERTLKFPLEKDELEWVENMDCDLNFRIKKIESNLNLYASFKVGKEELQELNDFAITYFDSFELTQTKFNALYQYYDEFLMQKIYGLEFDKYFEILDKIKDYYICNNDHFKSEVVDRYCELNNIPKEAKSFIDEDKIFEQLFEDTPLYLINKTMYVYHKADLDSLFEEKNLINMKNEVNEVEQEQEFDGMEM